MRLIWKLIKWLITVAIVAVITVIALIATGKITI